MNFLSIFDNTITTLENSLNIRARKHELIISNVANHDTPNYKAFDMVIEEEFNKIKGSKKELDLNKTNPEHLSLMSQTNSNYQPRILKTSDQITLRGDGNTVNIDKEMSDMAENTLMYRASTSLIASKFHGLKNVIRGGK